MKTTIINPEVKNIFPYIQEKLVIDFVNSINAAEDLNETRKQRSGLFSRVFNSISGTDHMRQSHINENLLSGLKTCETFINELMRDTTNNARAIVTLSENIQKLQENTIKLANRLSGSQVNFDDFITKVEDLRTELEETKRFVYAKTQLDHIIAKMEAGKFDNLAPLSRCYAVLDHLYWGAFGHRLTTDNDAADFLNYLEDRLITALKHNLQIEPTQKIRRDDWLAMPASDNKTDLIEALQYQGDWCLQAPEAYATTFTATQRLALGESHPQVENVHFLNLMDSQTVVKRIIRDVFGQERFV